MISVYTRPGARVLLAPRTIRRRCKKLLGLIDKPNAEIALVLTDDAEIRELNGTYREKDTPTDVLSFPQSTPDFQLPPGMPESLGDVVISVETAARQATQDGCLPRLRKALGAPPDHPWSLLDETTFLLVHGVLHLIGHDHMEPAERATMEALEHDLVARLLKGSGRSA